MTMVHMTNDSQRFMRPADLRASGWQQSALNRWSLGEEVAVPLYEGKMVQMYDHRAADVVLHLENLHRAAQPEQIASNLKTDPGRLARPQYWVQANDTRANRFDWALGFKEISAPTNARTMIAAVLPGVGFGNKIPTLIPEIASAGAAATVLAMLGANLNSFAFDFVMRQKLQGQTINWFILEQMPVIAAERFEQKIGQTKIADFVLEQVLALSYTAHDLAPFARDLGYVDTQGEVLPPFVWDDEDRRRRIAALDGLFMHLYGLNADDAAYILSTFPIVREQDMAAFGHFRTQADVLAQLAAINAGSLQVAAGV